MEKSKPLSYVKAIKILSPRECQVLDLVAGGRTNREIADEMHLSRRTIENHRRTICRKIGLYGRGALERWIARHMKTTQNNE